MAGTGGIGRTGSGTEPASPAPMEPALAALLADAHADLGRVCAWMEGEALPGGPALLVKRARAGLAAVRAYLDALDEELPPPAPGEAPAPSLAHAAARCGARRAAEVA